VWDTVRTRVRALVAPSRWYETGPLTVYEALAHGIPVIASTRAGAAEKIVDGVNGFAVAPEVEALAGAMRRLSDDVDLRALGRAASDRYWTAPMTLAAHAAALGGVYARIREARADLGRAA
jgi:glycosyltransferase involved in cell wall biosynthesis